MGMDGAFGKVGRTGVLQVLAVLYSCALAQGAPWLGGGTDAEPYLVRDADEMQAVGADPNYWDGHFKLTADIDLGGFGAANFNIIGHFNRSGVYAPFTGVFDGGGHTIRNFTYASTGADGIALFGYLGSSGEIRNLRLADVDVDAGAAGSYAAALVAVNEGTIRTCHATGSVVGYYGVGGLVGYNIGRQITACSAMCSVHGGTTVGGLVGQHAFGSMISSCYAAGSVNGTNNVGGLVGYCEQADISDCCAVASVTAARKPAGGLVGVNEGTISNCYAAGPVEAQSDPGGLAGVNGAISTIENSFWDRQTTGQSRMCGYAPAGGCDDTYGKTTVQMRKLVTFFQAGWDFVGESVNGTEDFWSMNCPDQSYPKPSGWRSPTGDFLCPNGVDMLDLAHLAEQWLDNTCDQPPCSPATMSYAGDFNADGIINFADFTILAKNWLTGI